MSLNILKEKIIDAAGRLAFIKPTIKEGLKLVKKPTDDEGHNIAVITTLSDGIAQLVFGSGTSPEATVNKANGASLKNVDENLLEQVRAQGKQLAEVIESEVEIQLDASSQYNPLPDDIDADDPQSWIDYLSFMFISILNLLEKIIEPLKLENHEQIAWGKVMEKKLDKLLIETVQILHEFIKAIIDSSQKVKDAFGNRFNDLSEQLHEVSNTGIDI